jgi:hypothetical protein
MHRRLRLTLLRRFICPPRQLPLQFVLLLRFIFRLQQLMLRRLMLQQLQLLHLMHRQFTHRIKPLSL